MANIATTWIRLQRLSCEHALRIWIDAGSPQPSRYMRSRGLSVPETIQDNVKILGRANEEELKARVLWYVTFHPTVFDACSQRNWEAN